ncbi:hypothetical protein HY065_00865 [Candidatus Berkelbacteria bacterium]|nr:hypothetical protein [Candidatus Berkelbacteria bacterium]
MTAKQKSRDIVLALREAQVYGTAGKKNYVAFCGVSNFECRYGVNFSMSTPDRFTVFVDNNDNKIYDAGTDTLVETIMLKSPIAISSVECLNYGGVNTVCSSLEGNTMLNITFKRPSPDAFINDTADPAIDSYELGRVTITNGIKTSTVTISKAGQISLQ